MTRPTPNSISWPRSGRRCPERTAMRTGQSLHQGHPLSTGRAVSERRFRAGLGRWRAAINDAITFTTNAVSESAETLERRGRGQAGLRTSFPTDLRKQAAAAVDKALQCHSGIGQIRDRTGKKTRSGSAGRCADAGARLRQRTTSRERCRRSESADLLSIDVSAKSSKELVASIQAGVTWLKARQSTGLSTPRPPAIHRADAEAKEAPAPFGARYFKAFLRQKSDLRDRDKTTARQREPASSRC